MTEVLAAGAVLWRGRVDSHEGEVALVHRPRYDDWSLPKGKLEPGESNWAAAVREVGEETGYPCFLGRYLGQLRYSVSRPVEATKVVEYFAARVAGPGKFEPGDEVDELRWLSLGEAAEVSSHDGDRSILRAFAELPASLTTLLLVRHAIAGERASWDGPDDLRPLNDAGRAQAAVLHELLPLFGADRIYAAPLVRCVQTVETLAMDRHLPIYLEPLLSEECYEEAATLARFREIVAAGGTPVVSSQGGVIPGLLSHLAKESGLALPHTKSAKGSSWLLSFTPDARLRAATYIPKP